MTTKEENYTTIEIPTEYEYLQRKFLIIAAKRKLKKIYDSESSKRSSSNSSNNSLAASIKN